jgi:hypothetical protein
VMIVTSKLDKISYFSLFCQSKKEEMNAVLCRD